jgi:hypothetical protein
MVITAHGQLRPLSVRVQTSSELETLAHSPQDGLKSLMLAAIDV